MFTVTINELFVYNFPGNHESFPVNMFPDQDDDVPSKYDPSWLYNKLADLYLHWLPDPVQQKTLRDSGYYSVCHIIYKCFNFDPYIYLAIMKK